MILARACLTSAALCFLVVCDVLGSPSEDFFLKLTATVVGGGRASSDQEFFRALPFPQDLPIEELSTADAYSNALDACVEEFAQALQQDQVGEACLARIASTQNPPFPEELALMSDLLLEREHFQEKLNTIYQKMITHVPGVCAVLPGEIRVCFLPHDGVFFSQVSTFIRLMRLYTTVYSFAQKHLPPLRSAVYFSPVRAPVCGAFESVMTQHAWFKSQFYVPVVQASGPFKKKVPPFDLEKVSHVHKVVSTYEGLTCFYHLFGNSPLYKTFKLIQEDEADETLTILKQTLYDPQVTPFMTQLLWSIIPHKDLDLYTAFSEWFVKSDKATLLYAKILYDGLSNMMKDFQLLNKSERFDFRLFFHTTSMHLEGKGSVKVMTPPKAKKIKSRRSRGTRG